MEAIFDLTIENKYNSTDENLTALANNPKTSFKINRANSKNGNIKRKKQCSC